MLRRSTASMLFLLLVGSAEGFAAQHPASIWYPQAPRQQLARTWRSQGAVARDAPKSRSEDLFKLSNVPALIVGFWGGPFAGLLFAYVLLGKLGLYELPPFREIGQLATAACDEAHLGVRLELISQFYKANVATAEFIPQFCADPSHSAWCTSAGLLSL